MAKLLRWSLHCCFVLSTHIRCQWGRGHGKFSLWTCFLVGNFCGSWGQLFIICETCRSPSCVLFLHFFEHRRANLFVKLTFFASSRRRTWVSLIKLIVNWEKTGFEGMQHSCFPWPVPRKLYRYEARYESMFVGVNPWCFWFCFQHAPVCAFWCDINTLMVNSDKMLRL